MAFLTCAHVINVRHLALGLASVDLGFELAPEASVLYGVADDPAQETAQDGPYAREDHGPYNASQYKATECPFPTGFK